ncbi:MAG: ATP-binding protein [Planctomycetota bacterium]|jgi:Pyruvate/2-oxoacid:ferredoxin oxidoreductase delta subunit
MAIRNIVKIDESKCNGCGKCVSACAEGAIQMIDGKAKLVSEIYCDGLGACLGCCPVDAIEIEQRDAAEFDEEATQKYLEEIDRNKAAAFKQASASGGGFVCPGMRTMDLSDEKDDSAGAATGDVSSHLGQWPVQLKLVSPAAPYFAGADILLVADCVPFAMGDFHEKLLKGKAIAIACPKLDDLGGYAEKLGEILITAKPKSLTVVHMEVPCCSGLSRIAQAAIALSGSELEIQDMTISLRGQIL